MANSSWRFLLSLAHYLFYFFWLFLICFAMTACGSRQLAPATHFEQKNKQTMQAEKRPIVWLYFSQASQTNLEKLGWMQQANTMPWEVFLRKYKIPMARISNAEEIEKIPNYGVLLLPSVVALSQADRDAIKKFRQRGGSILSTWLTGVRTENGDWVGYDFMENVLGVKVVGNTQDAKDDNFIVVHGDNPVFHTLPAGTRIWLDRIPSALPLRLEHKNDAAQIMDWSRTFTPDKKTSLVIFDEKLISEKITSRIVVFGYPEPATAVADPKVIELLAYSAITWLIRQPDAYIAAWPHPYQSAALMSIQAGDPVGDVDIEFLEKFEEKTGGKATIYLHGDIIPASARLVKKMQERGHEIGYLGDKFEGFKDQSISVQSQRFENMQKIFAQAGLGMGRSPGFAIPMDEYDENTIKIVLKQGAGHFISSNELTEARMPFVMDSHQDVRRATIALPRTILGPEDIVQESDDPSEGLQNFLDELDLAHRMGALNIIRLPTKTVLTKEQREDLLSHLGGQKKQVWIRSGGKIAQWWRDRSRVSTELLMDQKGLLLKATVVGLPLPQENVAIWINMPRLNSTLRLSSMDKSNPLPPVVKLDDWRSAIILEQLVPGEYYWYLHFDF